MFKMIFPSIPFFSALPLNNTVRDYIPEHASKIDVHTEINYRVTPKITVLSSYYGSISKEQHGKHIDSEVSHDVKEGDMLVMFLASSDGMHPKLPDCFIPILRPHDENHLSMTMAYCFWNKHTAEVFRIERLDSNYFVNLLTIRGAEYILDGRGRIDTASGIRGEAVTPRVETKRGIGAVISAFYYDDPHEVMIEKQKTLVSIANGGDGFAVGVGPAMGCHSSRIKAKSFIDFKGGTGDDIAMALSIF